MRDLPEATKRLHDAVRHCYQVFKGYTSQPGWVDCMVSGLEFCPRKSAREFTPEEVADHYAHATDFVGKAQAPNQIQATKFFLPRILEMICGGECVSAGLTTDWWWLGKQWRDANWWDWPSDERKALAGWIAAWWYGTLNVDFLDDLREGDGPSCPTNRDPLEILQVALRSETDPLGVLSSWEACQTVTASLHIAVALIDSETALQRMQIGHGSKIAGIDVEEKIIAGWLMRPATRQRLEKEFLASASPAMQYWMWSGIEAFDRIIVAQEILRQT